MYLCCIDSHSKIAKIRICMNIIYWSSQFGFGLVIEILRKIKHQFSTCNTHHSTLAAGRLINVSILSYLSKKILLFSNNPCTIKHVFSRTKCNTQLIL